MLEAYFSINCVAYIGLSLWCAASVEKTARSIGFEALNASGRCEFTAVYGGLQLGLGIIFGLLAWHPELNAIGLIFSLSIYGGIVLFRAIGLSRFWPVAPMTLGFAGMELLMLLGALLLMLSGTQQVTSI